MKASKTPSSERKSAGDSYDHFRHATNGGSGILLHSTNTLRLIRLTIGFAIVIGGMFAVALHGASFV